MSNTTMVIVGILVIALLGGGFAYFRYRKRNLDQLFEEVYASSRQIPKQKKMSYLLLMFKTSMSASKDKDKAQAAFAKFQNPKFLEIQLVQMSTYLRDRGAVKDKKIKRSLQLLDAYLQWEKEKNGVGKAKPAKAEKSKKADKNDSTEESKESSAPKPPRKPKTKKKSKK